MLKRINRWNRRRLFLKAYRILRNECERHQNAGHMASLIAVNESLISLMCYHCPDLQPDAPKGRGRDYDRKRRVRGGWTRVEDH